MRASNGQLTSPLTLPLSLTLILTLAHLLHYDTDAVKKNDTKSSLLQHYLFYNFYFYVSWSAREGSSPLLLVRLAGADLVQDLLHDILAGVDGGGSAALRNLRGKEDADLRENASLPSFSFLKSGHFVTRPKLVMVLDRPIPRVTSDGWFASGNVSCANAAPPVNKMTLERHVTFSPVLNTYHLLCTYDHHSFVSSEKKEKYP